MSLATGTGTTLATASARGAETDLSLRHPALWLAALIAAACVVASVSDRLFEPAFWQHLAVGKTIWEQTAPPQTQLWSWPSYGAPLVDGTWGFRALLWPVWSALGVTGVFALRWVLSLLAFGLVWAAARRLGARGFTPLFVCVVGSLLWRERAQASPEMLAGLLLALEIWILERRRAGGPDHAWLLAPVAWAWVNTHLSFPLFVLVIAAYLVNDFVARKPHGFESALAPRPRRLWIAAVVALAACFANPYGWRAVWQPFEVFLHAGDDLGYRAMIDVPAGAWLQRWRTGFPALVVLWPVLLVWRWWRSGFDLVETALCAAFTWLAFTVQGGTTFYAIAMVPFVSRDLALALRVVPRPEWTGSPLARVASLGAACVIAGLAEWSRPERPLAMAVDMRQVPQRASDFLQTHDLRGRMFNHAHQGGYLAYRFAPNRERLPFMDAAQAGTRLDRLYYSRVFLEADGWRRMDNTYRFDWVLLDASQSGPGGDRLKDRLDADTTWSLVFLDDAAAVYLRRSGRYAPLARRLEYIAIPGGEARLQLLGVATQQDSMLRQLARLELQRQMDESPYNARAHSMMANLDIAIGDFASARRRLEEALRQDPFTFAAHERLGMMAMANGRAREAVEEFELEKRLTGGTPELPQRLAQARAIARGAAPPRPGG